MVPLFLAASFTAQAAETSLTRLRADSRTLLREEALAKGDAKKYVATEALCDMYMLLRNDARYVESNMLQGDAAKVRRRLIAIKRRLESKLKRENVPRPGAMATEVDAAIASSEREESEEAGERGNSGSSNAGRAAGPFDEGWRLVELIERIIAPDFWEGVGGPGSVRYFAMRRVLVVRATTDVHEQIKDLLMALR